MSLTERRLPTVRRAHRTRWPFRDRYGGGVVTIPERCRALFNVPRRRVQRLVDRRFNRARYDADTTVALFAARLKDAVDVGAVREDLAAVVQQALEPASLSVWLRR